MTDQILIDLPAEISTDRLIVRAPRVGDGAVVNAGIVESFTELNRWMPWAAQLPSVQDSEQWVRNAAVNFARRSELPMLLFSRRDGTFVGASGLHHIDWSVPRFEIGYWIRTPLTGRGFITEAVVALTEFCFAQLGAARVDIRMDPENTRSRAIPERLGFTFEGTLRRDMRSNDGSLRDTCVFAMIDPSALRRAAPR